MRLVGVLLSWDTPDTDLDMHVVGPDGSHASYGERMTPNGDALDVDVTTGYGPEIFSSAAPPAGNYQARVNYYGGAGTDDMITADQVSIIANKNTPHEKQLIFRVPMRTPGELTLVRSFVFP